MKNALRKYIALIVFLLLGAIANLNATPHFSNTLNKAALQTLGVASHTSSCVYEGRSNSATVTPYHQEKDHSKAVEVVESNSAEDEETSSRKPDYKAFFEIALINAILLEQSTHQRKKNAYRPQGAFTEHSLPLHVQFQVFII